MFNIKYQIFLNDLYYYGAIDLLNYGMVKSYLETLDYMLNPDVQVRFNKKNSRLYMDLNIKELTDNHFLIIDALESLILRVKLLFTMIIKEQTVYHILNKKTMGTKPHKVYWC